MTLDEQGSSSSRLVILGWLRCASPASRPHSRLTRCASPVSRPPIRVSCQTQQCTSTRGVPITTWLVEVVRGRRLALLARRAKQSHCSVAGVAEPPQPLSLHAQGELDVLPNLMPQCDIYVDGIHRWGHSGTPPISDQLSVNVYRRGHRSLSYTEQNASKERPQRRRPARGALLRRGVPGLVKRRRVATLRNKDACLQGSYAYLPMIIDTLTHAETKSTRETGAPTKPERASFPTKGSRAFLRIAASAGQHSAQSTVPSFA